MSRFTLFIDDGGVMNDNMLRGPQWQRLVGEFFVPLLGGTPEAWSNANHIVASQLLDAQNWQTRLQSAIDYVSFDRAYQKDWLGGMCELVGISLADEETCIDLAQRATFHISRRVHADFPGAIDAIRTLHAQSYTLHTASGESSTDLAGYLEGMGVRDCFGTLYGPDLLNTFKNGPEYYERLFAHAGIEPSQALIVDDSSLAIGWATQVGAQTVLVSTASENIATFCISSLAALPATLQHIA